MQFTPTLTRPRNGGGERSWSAPQTTPAPSTGAGWGGGETQARFSTKKSLCQRAAEHALGRGHGVGLARIDGDRGAQRAGETLVATLDDVVVVLAVDVFDMQRQACGLGEGVEPLAEEFGIHFP